MRYLHKEFAPIRQHLEGGTPDIRRLEWELNPIVKGPLSIFDLKAKRRSAAPPSTASVADIKAIFDLSGDPLRAAAVLAGYFHVNAPPSNRAVSLAAAIEHVEAYGGPDEFLLAGHPEGGVISVSRGPLPFQDGLEQIDSWAPDTRWKP